MTESEIDSRLRPIRAKLANLEILVSRLRDALAAREAALQPAREKLAQAEHETRRLRGTLAVREAFLRVALLSDAAPPSQVPAQTA